MILHNLKRTHTAPSRWTATNEQDQPVFIQFQFDRLVVHCPYSPVDAKGNRLFGREDFQNYMHSQIVNKENIYGDARNSRITNQQMLEITGYQVAEEKVQR